MAVSQTKAPRVAVVTEAGRDDHSFPRDGRGRAGRAGQAVGPEPRRSPQRCRPRADNPDLPPLSRQLNASQ